MFTTNKILLQRKQTTTVTQTVNKYICGGKTEQQFAKADQVPLIWDTGIELQTNNSSKPYLVDCLQLTKYYCNENKQQQ